MFELFGARLRNTLHIRALAGSRFRKLLRQAEHGEKEFEHALKEFQERFHEGGIIEEVDSAFFDIIKRVEGEELRILRIEEETVVYLFTTFEEVYKGIISVQPLGVALSEHQQQFSNDTKARAAKVYQAITQLLRKDADETYAMLLKFARAFRDQYDALEKTSNGEEARERLRDMVGTMTVVFKDLQERRKARAATKDAKRIHKDVKAEEKVIDELEKLLSNINKHFDEKLFVKDLNKLEAIIKDESETINKYLEDTQIYLLLSVRHYFLILEHVLKTRKEIDFLREDNYSKKSLDKMVQREEKELKTLSDKSLKVMREMYQLYHKFEKLKSGANQVRKAA